MKTTRLAALSLLALAVFSCKKSNNETDTPFVDVTVSGRAYAVDGNTPLAGKTVSVNWSPALFILPGMPVPDPTANPMATVITGADGRYSVVLRLDSRENSYQKGIYVSLPIDTLHEASRAGWAYLPKALYAVGTGTYGSTALASSFTIDLPVYRRAMLTIRQQQVQPGGVIEFKAFYGHPNPEWGYLPLSGQIAFQQASGDPGTVTVPTLANRKTYISWDARLQGNGSSGVDSLYITEAGPNEYTIRW